LLAVTVLLVVAAGRGEQNGTLVATWELKSIAAHPPSALNIRSWKLAFVLSPDPVVMPDGKTPVTTTYQRVSR
jgi:hypothetical protein